MLEQTWEDISTNGASESFHDCWRLIVVLKFI
jgi:hypothetical protein